MTPGAPAADAPVAGPAGEWLLDYVGGGFVLLVFDAAIASHELAALAGDALPCRIVHVGGTGSADGNRIDDIQRLAAKRYDARPGTVYLLRPDQHVCARWRSFDLARVRSAIARATCNT
jgi:3-(3-hydroxy-phenyl)propionate hydroxylase